MFSRYYWPPCMYFFKSQNLIKNINKKKSLTKKIMKVLHLFLWLCLEGRAKILSVTTMPEENMTRHQKVQICILFNRQFNPPFNFDNQFKKKNLKYDTKTNRFGF